MFKLNWEKGRQEGGYYKAKLFISKKFCFDIFLLKYPKWSYIPNHKDPVKDGFEHHRINVVLKMAKKGGIYKGQYDWKFLNCMKIRPDKHFHMVTMIKSGTRYVLSVGWLQKEKEKKIMRKNGFYKIKLKPYGYDKPIWLVGYWSNGVEDVSGKKTPSYFDCSNFSEELSMVMEKECIEINEKIIC